MKKNEDALQKIISRFTTEWQKTSKQAVEELYKMLDSGKKVDIAVRELAKKYPELFMLTGIEDALIEAAAYGYGIVPEILTTAQQAQWQEALNRPWADDNMKLSERLHGASKKMRESIVDTLRKQMKLNASWIKTARELYDGYNSGKAVMQTQQLPDYLKIVRHASDSERQIALARKAWRNVERLSKNGAPNQALKAAYKKLLKTAEEGSAEALEKACWVAMQEKSRYVAERIARTEMARAYADGFLAKAEADSDIVAFKWKTGTRHPMFDICDMYAKADMYGLGAGIYPKDKLPPLPAHPHCMCRLVEMYLPDIKGKQAKENIEAAGNTYLKTLSANQRMHLMGINGAKAWKSGESWQDYMRGWQGLGKQESRVYGALSGALNDKNDPLGKRRLIHAEKYYEARRKNGMNAFVNKIHKNTGCSKKRLESIYKHVFINEYDLADGHHQFYPSFEMAQSFQRLLEGKNIQEHDLLMLKHEHLEFAIMKKLGYNYDRAHNLTNTKYNYSLAESNWRENNVDT